MNAATGIEVIPLSEAIGAEIRGIDIRRIDDAQFDLIIRAWHEHVVLLFRDQHIGPEEHLAFSKRFGELERAPVTPHGDPWLSDYPHIAVMSNIVDNGAAQGSLGAGEAIWHTDMSYRECPPSASLLYALEVPDDGSGDTGFANMYRAYDALSAEKQRAVAKLVIVHDASRNSADQQRKGFDIVTDPRAAPGARHPALRTHPDTGRRALFLGRRRNAYIVGLGVNESEAALDALWAHATRAEFTWHHRWRVGDLLIWDNRASLHRRDAFEPSLRRRMHRTQVKGTAPTLVS